MKPTKTSAAADAALDEMYRLLDIEAGAMRRRVRAEGNFDRVETVEELTELATKAGRVLHEKLVALYESRKSPVPVQLGFGRERFERDLQQYIYDTFSEFMDYCCTVPCDAAKIMKQKHLCNRAHQHLLESLADLHRQLLPVDGGFEAT